MKLPNFIIRVLAGAVFVGLLLSGILFNEYFFAGIFSFITGLALFEFYTLVNTNKETSTRPSRIMGIVAGVVLFLSSYLYQFHNIKVTFAIYIILILIINIRELYLKKENPLLSLSNMLFGQFYVAVPFALTNYLVYHGGQFQSAFLLAICVFIWVNDSFAYLTGMTFGKRRLFERISPKKSWEGFIGGAVFTIAVSGIFFYFFSDLLNITGWIGFAMVTVAFGTWGDLIESLIKRTLKVKDSGNMIPGHGGILDRMDSTIVAIPAVVVYLMLIEYFSHLI